MVSKRDHIDKRQALNIERAWEYAASIGKQPNLFVTINFGIIGGSEDEMCQAFRNIRNNRFRKWLSRRAQRIGRKDLAVPVHIWALENSKIDYHGSHWLIHIPEPFRHDFDEALITSWVRGAMGKVDVPGNAIQVKEADNRSSLMRYLIKGVKPGCRKRFKTEKWPFMQGIITGKRCGTSKSIGASARENQKSLLTAAA